MDDRNPPPPEDLDLTATVPGLSSEQKFFGCYVLLRVLGRGGMGVVWLARDEKLDREVALKFLPEAVQLNPEAIAELKRETKRALALTHPHIVRVHDFLQSPEAACICMEYVGGETLSSLKVQKPAEHFEVGDISPWLPQLIEALEYAHHTARVVHRDLKPANLMLTQDGQIKITDFGISSSLSDSLSRISIRHSTSGSPPYASPQQLEGERPSSLDDIYSFGATLYDLLTGKPPFFRGNIIGQVHTSVPPSMALRREEFGISGAPIPAHWETTIAACLAKSPADRPRDLREVAARLGLSGAEIPTIQELASQPAKSRPLPWRAALTTIGALTVLAAAGTWQLNRSRAITPTPSPSTPPSGLPSSQKPGLPALPPAMKNRMAERFEQMRPDGLGPLAKIRELAPAPPGSPARAAELAASYEKAGQIDKAIEQWVQIEAQGESTGAYYVAAQAKLKELRAKLAPPPSPPVPSAPPSPSAAPALAASEPPPIAATPAVNLSLLSGLEPSSVLVSQIDNDGHRYGYRAENATDGNLLTAWAPARGSHEASLIFRFKTAVSISECLLFGGYGKNQTTFRTNNRVKDFALEFSTGEKRQFHCEDAMRTQEFRFPTPIVCKWVKFQILSVHAKGGRFDDTPISEISFR